jgi:hypothetical protein
MDFRVVCACGEYVTVTEGDAGAKVRCSCGQRVQIPSLKELRLSEGLPAHNLSPELVIEYQLAAGDLPGDRVCARCGSETDNVVHVLVECERAYCSGGPSWFALLLCAIISPFAILLRWRDEGEVHGRDKVYRLPLAACPGCRDDLRSRQTLKRSMRRIEVYAQLLDKFPDAPVSLVGP